MTMPGVGDCAVCTTGVGAGSDGATYGGEGTGVGGSGGGIGGHDELDGTIDPSQHCTLACGGGGDGVGGTYVYRGSS